jgi:hypothetical protein
MIQRLFRMAPCIGLALLLAAPLVAQSSPAPIKYGKWLLLAGSLGLNVSAAGAHEDADRAYDSLRDRCATDPALCAIAGGQYLDPASESLYQEALRNDRRSRKLLIGGEAALLGAATLFVWEFARPRGRPENIPFEPAVSYRDGVTRLGVQMAW